MSTSVLERTAARPVDTDETRMMAWQAEISRTLRRPRVMLSRRGYDIAKRILDLTLCIAVMPVVAPLVGICALAIRLDTRGPVFFTQLRTGRGGARFRAYKLRTMVADAEALKEQYAHLNKLSWPDFKIADDPRVTRVGRVLRKLSLDELPQIINVLRGEMSLVGPRPTSFAVSRYSLWHTERLEVLPGITGLAQINGRNDIDFDERIRLDIRYIEQRGLWLDIVILFRTLWVLVRRRGAY